MYYIVFILGAALSIINSNKRRNFTILACALAIMAFLRHGVGSDYFSYQHLYARLDTSIIREIYFSNDPQEVGFRIIGSILKKIGFSYQAYIVVLSALNLFFLALICKKYSRNPVMSFLVYFCFYYLVWTYSGLRQGLTIPIGVYYLLECIERKRNIKDTMKFMLIIYGLTFIHQSVIILVPLYFMSWLNLSRKHLTILSILSIGISMAPLGNILSEMHWIPFASRLAPYIQPRAGLIQGLDFASIGRIFFMGVALWHYEDYSEESDMSKKIITIYLLSLMIYFGLKFSELTAARLSLYGKILDIIIIPNIYYLYKSKVTKMLCLTCILLLSFAYLNKELNTMRWQTGLVLRNEIGMPYTNVFNKNDYSYDNYYYVLTRLHLYERDKGIKDVLTRKTIEKEILKKKLIERNLWIEKLNEKIFINRIMVE